jgi:RNA polymerase primary sigma factor
LREALENLSYRERRVLELRYGLGGEHPQTLDEVGRTFQVTRERIRQIENQSLKKLQHLPQTQRLRDELQTGSVAPRRPLRHPTWSY